MVADLTWLTRPFRPVFLLMLFVQGSTALLANGWEHTAIPVASLVEALSDDDAGIRSTAAHSLSYHRTPAVTQALVRRLEAGEAVATVRQVIYRSLGKIADPVALPLLSKCLAEESQPAVRVECAEALSAFNQPEAEALVLQSVVSEDTSVRIAAIRSLGNFRSETTRRAIAEYLKDSDAVVRRQAIAAAATLSDAATLETLLALLDRGDDAEKIEVLKALTRRGDPKAKAAIDRLFGQSGNPRLKRFAFIARAAIDTVDDKRILRKALQDPDPLLNLQALEFVRESDSIELATELVHHGEVQLNNVSAYLSKPIPSTLQSALLALTMVSELLRTLIAIDPAAGLELYVSIADSVPAETITGDLALAEGIYRARWQAIYGLGYTRDARVHRILRSAATDSDPRIRAVAVRSMGVFGASVFRQAIGQAMADSAPEVRWTAASVMGRDRQMPDSRLLLSSLRDPHAGVRREAAFSLGYLGAANAVEALQRLANKDPDERVRAAATLSVRLIDGSP